MRGSGCGDDGVNVVAMYWRLGYSCSGGGGSNMRGGNVRYDN